MEDSRWLRVITVGLVLAAMAVGYFLLTGKLSSNSTRVQSQVSKVAVSPSPSSVLGLNTQPSPVPAIVTSPSPTPLPTATPAPTPPSAYNTLANRSQTDVQTLPRTGFPVALAVIFSLSAIVSGFSLRQFPK